MHVAAAARVLAAQKLCGLAVPYRLLAATLPLGSVGYGQKRAVATALVRSILRAHGALRQFSMQRIDHAFADKFAFAAAAATCLLMAAGTRR